MQDRVAPCPNTFGSKDVTISRLQGKLAVSILDRILFDSGEAVVKPDGEAVLRKVAAILPDELAGSDVAPTATTNTPALRPASVTGTNTPLDSPGEPAGGFPTAK